MGYGLEPRPAVIAIRNKITPRDIEWMEWCGFIQNSDWYINTYAHCNRNILTLDWTMKFIKKTFKII